MVIKYLYKVYWIILIKKNYQRYKYVNIALDANQRLICNFKSKIICCYSTSNNKFEKIHNFLYRIWKKIIVWTLTAIFLKSKVDILQMRLIWNYYFNKIKFWVIKHTKSKITQSLERWSERDMNRLLYVPLLQLSIGNECRTYVGGFSIVLCSIMGEVAKICFL